MIGLLPLLALLSGALGEAAGGGPARPPGDAHAVGPCSGAQVCAFANPEDLADLTGTAWLLVSQQDAANPATGLAAFNTLTGEIIRYPRLADDPACPAGAHGGGIGVRREPGGYRLVRIVHGAGTDAVETYRVTIRAGRPAIDRTACVAAPLPLFLNDIAPLGDGFAATHMFDRSIDRAAREVRFLAGLPTGHVMRWSSVGGWQQVPNSEGSFPNGLAVSQDGRWIAFAETYGRAIDRIRPDGSGRSRIELAMQPDNVTATSGGRFVVVGGTGRPLLSTRDCPALRNPGCGFAAAAQRVDFRTGKVTDLVRSGGDSIPGFSVGLVKGRTLYLGTSFGDRITPVPMRRGG